jgi:hypothetical protein
MPNVRRSDSIFIASCVARHCVNRASSGCEDCSWSGWADEFVGAGVVRPSEERRVSWMPGAEGAPV